MKQLHASGVCRCESCTEVNPEGRAMDFGFLRSNDEALQLLGGFVKAKGMPSIEHSDDSTTLTYRAEDGSTLTFRKVDVPNPVILPGGGTIH